MSVGGGEKRQKYNIWNNDMVNFCDKYLLIMWESCVIFGINLLKKFIYIDTSLDKPKQIFLLKQHSYYKSVVFPWFLKINYSDNAGVCT